MQTLLTFTECFILSVDALDKEPMCHERYVLMQIVNRYWNIATAAAEFDVRVAGKNKVQSEISDWASIEIQSLDLESKVKLTTDIQMAINSSPCQSFPSHPGSDQLE